MASLVPHKPCSSSSSYGDENKLPSSVTTCLYLIKPDDAAGGGERRSLDKEVVLRRIRQRKRVSRLRAALQSLLKPAPGIAKEEGEPKSMLDDAFSFP
ncbi:hypothetical protein Cni_G08323 [Canna indica]|uniref:Uncharacterized protein n=1 Tax=Canna indica TaxID=4628 RepID=A0AAQ3K3X6_9LILI|nr:hypothetical protein Cni_G08323 [Canna indica]